MVSDKIPNEQPEDSNDKPEDASEGRKKGRSSSTEIRI